MQYLLTILDVLLGLLGYIFSFIINWDRLKKKKLLIVLILLMAIIFIGIQLMQRHSQELKEDQFQIKYDSLLAINQYLINQNDSLKNEIRRLSIQLEPIIKLATDNFPGLGVHAAIEQLLSKIKGMESKIKYLKSETHISSEDGNYITNIYFGSEYPVAVRDIDITLEFDKSILDAKYRFDGAFVIEQGSNLKLTSNNKKIQFTTGLLAVGNDIIIQTISRDSVMITDISCRSR